MKILFLITARGGSKRVPGKNLKRLGGLSLIGFKAVSAQKSKYCTRLILSTDDHDIQEEGRRHGAEVPFTRPAELASDSATSEAVVRHAMEWIEQSGGEAFDAVMLLEPAAPFTRAEDYDQAIELMIAKRANVVVGVKPVTINSLYIGPLDSAGRIASIVTKMNAWQDRGRPRLEQEYTMNAALYLFRWDFFKHHRRIYVDAAGTYGYEMDPHYSVEIDNADELHYAEFLVERGYVDMSYWKRGTGA